MKDTKTASLEDIRAMKARGDITGPRADVPALDMPDGFWDVALPQGPKTKKQVNMRVDPDTLAFSRRRAAAI